MFKIFLLASKSKSIQIPTSYLEQENWEVCSFNEGESALQSIHEYPHLWILDSTLPGIDTYLILRRIKEQTPDIPIIFIFPPEADFDRFINLASGSDDFLLQPYSLRELLIRIKRLLQRSYSSANINISRINLHPYSLDERKREVCLGMTKIELTSKEYDLLLYFAKQRGKGLSREQIINRIWGNDHIVTDRSVDDLVRRLRRKMQELRIETLYGYGYRMILQ